MLKPEESIEDLKARCLVALFESWKERNLKADTDELVLRRLRGELDESDAQLARQVESCHRARLRSPEILASKARLRRRKMRRGWRPRSVDEGRNNVRDLSVLTVPTCQALAQWPQMVPIGTR